MTPSIDTIHLDASRLWAHLATLRTEIERAPLLDADPARDPAAVSRIAIIEHVLDAAETSATTVRAALSTLMPRQGDVESVQLDAGGTEAMLVLLGRELGRAAWDASDGRIALLSELVRSAQDAARRVRVGLGAVADRLTVGV